MLVGLHCIAGQNVKCEDMTENVSAGSLRKASKSASPDFCTSATPTNLQSAQRITMKGYVQEK